ncbi:hypothetical protein DsansV1_C05g0058511 [Dioscorea sansibarensis]
MRYVVFHWVATSRHRLFVLKISSCRAISANFSSRAGDALINFTLSRIL